MMYIAETMQSQYDITVGVFRPIPIAEKSDRVTWKVTRSSSFRF